MLGGLEGSDRFGNIWDSLLMLCVRQDLLDIEKDIHLQKTGLSLQSLHSLALESTPVLISGRKTHRMAHGARKRILHRVNNQRTAIPCAGWHVVISCTTTCWRMSSRIAYCSMWSSPGLTWCFSGRGIVSMRQSVHRLTWAALLTNFIQRLFFNMKHVGCNNWQHGHFRWQCCWLV